MVCRVWEPSAADVEEEDEAADECVMTLVISSMTWKTAENKVMSEESDWCYTVNLLSR